ncbi:hypothetical protein NEFER03_1013 [Nematocida sp. LUAm3]|nr:hypothetical protein NEFER03_1013 [Nematocida sp. LUAm3]KAI5175383.1 hypothetical protein NEFER02_1312 [Nematocida sp. LUAm2]KAI5177660.1 hypothetical protein NEFER01_0884 [Nematocida sp. LUAm1]
MEEGKIRDSLNGMESMNLNGEFFIKEEASSAKEFLLVRNLMPIAVLYCIAFLNNLMQTADAYVHLLLWNTCLCFLFNTNFFILLIASITEYSSADDFLHQLLSKHTMVKLSSLLAFVPCCLFICRYKGRVSNMNILSCICKVGILVFSYILLYTVHYGIFSLVVLMILWMVANLSIIWFYIVLYAMLWIVVLVLKNQCNKALNEWMEEESRVENSNLYKWAEKQMREAIVILTDRTGELCLILLIYLALRYETVSRLSKVDDLIDTFYGIKDKAFNIFSSDVISHIVVH